MHAADIAEIYERLSLEQAYFLHVVLEDDKGADILMELEDSLKAVRKTLSKEIAEEILENLDSDDAADIVLDLPKDVKEEVLSYIKNLELASDIADLLNYPEDSAGGLMAKNS